MDFIYESSNTSTSSSSSDDDSYSDNENANSSEANVNNRHVDNELDVSSTQGSSDDVVM